MTKKFWNVIAIITSVIIVIAVPGIIVTFVTSMINMYETVHILNELGKVFGAISIESYRSSIIMSVGGYVVACLVFSALALGASVINDVAIKNIQEESIQTAM